MLSARVKVRCDRADTSCWIVQPRWCSDSCVSAVWCRTWWCLTPPSTWTPSCPPSPPSWRRSQTTDPKTWTSWSGLNVWSCTTRSSSLMSAGQCDPPPQWFRQQCFNVDLVLDRGIVFVSGAPCKRGNGNTAWMETTDKDKDINTILSRQ